MAKFLKKGLLLSVVLVLGCTFSGMSSPVSLAGLKDEEVSRCAELCRYDVTCVADCVDEYSVPDIKLLKRGGSFSKRHQRPYTELPGRLSLDDLLFLQYMARSK